jgi:DNA polymerase V
MEDHSQTLAHGDGVSVHAGFPNPALDRRGQGQRLALDLNQLLVRHPSSTYLFRISGHLWADQGIYDGDVAVIDRTRRPQIADIILSWEGEDFTLSRYHQQAVDRPRPWGVVTAIIHPFTG